MPEKALNIDIVLKYIEKNPAILMNISLFLLVKMDGEEHLKKNLKN